MWVFVPGAFVSIVADREDEVRLLVRARRVEDLERFYAAAGMTLPSPPIELARADYRFRVVDSRDRVSTVMLAHVDGLAYPNFKDAALNRDRQGMLHEIWSVVRAWATVPR